MLNVFKIYICSFIRMSQIKVNLYCIVTRKLKSYVKDFNLCVTMYYLRNIY